MNSGNQHNPDPSDTDNGPSSGISGRISGIHGATSGKEQPLIRIAARIGCELRWWRDQAQRAGYFPPPRVLLCFSPCNAWPQRQRRRGRRHAWYLSWRPSPVALAPARLATPPPPTHYHLSLLSNRVPVGAQNPSRPNRIDPALGNRLRESAHSSPSQTVGNLSRRFRNQL
jgi:hypothetical protein